MHTFKSHCLLSASVCLAMVMLGASCGGESDSTKTTSGGSGGTGGAGTGGTGTGGTRGGAGGATGGTGGATGGAGGATGGAGGATGGAGGTTGGTGGATGGSGGATGGSGGATGGAGGATGGAAGAAGTAGSGGTGMPEGGGGCPQYTNFTLGIHIILEVTWKGAAGGTTTLDGSGQVHLWNKATLTANGTALSGEAMSCGTTLPDIVLGPLGNIAAGGVNGKVSIAIPFASWDAPIVPKFQENGTLAGWTVGSAINMEPTVALVGLTMPDPMAAWPASFTGITGVDAEGDGNLGITGIPKKDGTNYVYPPTAIGLGGAQPVADKVYIASRTVVQLTGKTTSCEEQAGTATAKFFDNHVIGCHVFNGGECTNTGNGNQTDFIDASRTIYVPTSGTFTSKKLADNASCADVRAALP